MKSIKFEDGPAWDLSIEYASFSAPEFLADQDELARLTAEIAQASIAAEIAIMKIGEIFGLIDRASVLLLNLWAYTQGQIAVNTRNADARAWRTKIQTALLRLNEAEVPLIEFLGRADDTYLAQLMAMPEMAAHRFALRCDLELREQKLSSAEEVLVMGLAGDGHVSWGNLYSTIAAELVCEVHHPTDGLKKVGVTVAQAWVESADADVRKAAYLAVQSAWAPQKSVCAAILNALSGWRLEVCRRRSTVAAKPVHVLAAPLHANRIQRATLDTLLQTVRAAAPQVRARQNTTAVPWDAAPPGAQARYSFSEAIQIIGNAVGAIDSSLRDFVKLARAQNWIDARSGEDRQSGAYCTKFPKSRTPGVYLNFSGTLSDVETLAHELGHAYHYWALRDLGVAETRYPLTLAETASLSFEHSVRESLVKKARADGDLKAITALEAAATQSRSLYLLNIPARFEFECDFYSQRENGILSGEEIHALHDATFSRWYGEPGSISAWHGAWLSKHHYYMTKTSFYNFPYLFGYLFSLGVLAQREKLGTEFFAAYSRLLRDTGRMTVEALAQRHLGADLTRPEFWEESIRLALGE